MYEFVYVYFVMVSIFSRLTIQRSTHVVDMLGTNSQNARKVGQARASSVSIAVILICVDPVSEVTFSRPKDCCLTAIPRSSSVARMEPAPKASNVRLPSWECWPICEQRTQCPVGW
jgi:hypothetical protein